MYVYIYIFLQIIYLEGTLEDGCTFEYDEHHHSRMFVLCEFVENSK